MDSFQIDFDVIYLQTHVFPVDNEVNAKRKISMRSEPIRKRGLTQQVVRFPSPEGMKQI